MTPHIEEADIKDLDRLAEIEALTFPPAEAAPADTFAYRIRHFREWFYVAKEDGKIIGLINGRRTPLDRITDELYEPAGVSAGEYLALLCLETDPAWQKKGVAEAMINYAVALARKCKVTAATLACKDRLIHYYAKFGFVDMGVSQSVHGGAVWHDMKLVF